MCEPILLACQFLDSDILPSLMQNVGLALLTILIPLVIFIFSLGDRELFEWDKVVIIDKVIEAKKLFLSVIFIFFPLFFWGYESVLLKYLLFLVFLCGVIYLSKILLNSYRWARAIEIEKANDPNSFRDNLRNEYLSEINNLEEKEKIWSLTWRKIIPNTVYERVLIGGFIKNVDALVKKRNFDLLQRYLQNFFTFIDNRPLYDWPIFEKFFRSLLEWYFILYADNAKSAEKNGKNRVNFLNTESILLRLVERFTLSALQKGTTYIFFEELKRAKDKEAKALERLFTRSVCAIFFDNIEKSRERHDIWEYYFPDEWKITRETFKDQENIISKIWLHSFLQWAINKIREPKDDLDSDLDEVASGLFPSVDPIFWAKILTFLMRPWEDNNRMKSLIERGTKFGFAGRIMIDDFESPEESSKRMQENIKSQEEEALKLALLLFPRDLRKRKLEGFVKDLDLLKREGTREEDRRKNFILIFEKMIFLLEKGEKNPDTRV